MAETKTTLSQRPTPPPSLTAIYEPSSEPEDNSICTVTELQTALAPQLPNIPSRLFLNKEYGDDGFYGSNNCWQLPAGDEAVVPLQKAPTKNSKKESQILANNGIRYNSRILCFICEPCGIALLRQSVQNHLTRKKGGNHCINGRGMKEELEGLDDSQKFAETLPAIHTMYGGSAIEGLRIEAAIRCDEVGCRYVTTTINSMTSHLGLEHKKPRSKLPHDKSWPTVYAQRFGHSPPLSNQKDSESPRILFEVILLPNVLSRLVPARKPEEDEDDSMASARKAPKNADLLRFEHALDQAVKGMPLHSDDPRDMNLWLFKSKWPQHVGEHLESSFLRSLVAPTDKEYPLLNKAVVKLLEAANEKIPKTSNLILRQLNSRDPVLNISKAPFGKHESLKTLSDYAREVSKLIAFLLRDRKEYTLHLPKATQERLNKLSNMKNPNMDHYRSHIKELLLDIWTRKWVGSEENSIGDPTLCYLALASIDSDGTWSKPKVVTGTIARLMWSMRAIFLLECHQKRWFPHSSQIENTPAGEAKTIEFDPVLAPQSNTSSSHIIDVSETYKQVQEWQSVNTDCTFGSLANLQRTASAIVFSSMELPQVAWMDLTFNSLVYHGYQISVAHLRDMCWKLHSRIWEVFHKEVLLEQTHLLVSIGQAKGQWSLDKPDGTEGKIGDTKKALPLISAILETPNLASEFIEGSTKARTLNWNYKRMQTWLNAYSEFQRLSMICVLVMASPSIKGTSLIAFLQRGTSENLRNIYVTDNGVIITTHSGRRSLTGYRFKAVYGLDPITASFLVQDAVFIRRTAQFFLMKTEPDQVSSLLPYFTRMFVKKGGQLFDTADITSSLRELTLGTIGYEFGIHDLQHILVAVQDAHCPEFREAVYGGNSDTFGAKQSGHSSATENRIYAVGSAFATGHSDEKIPHFVHFSGRYQAALGVPAAGTMELSCALVQNRDEYTRVATETARILQERGQVLDEVNRFVPTTTNPVVGIPDCNDVHTNASCSEAIFVPPRDNGHLHSNRRTDLYEGTHSVVSTNWEGGDFDEAPAPIRQPKTGKRTASMLRIESDEDASDSDGASVRSYEVRPPRRKRHPVKRLKREVDEDQ
ncbi:hypothetical protein NP233_g1733 [Leucocoprinus birnbaumii]|uniref:Uncharacterized protein n=1 Tax=Leucocoprinus birnbaumii TaxID=56174 RepID=A0AAD5YXR7_9AGAR|nr:hypothetical protein NP233_g1733 [Leucocoprinus birnbaumii]